MTRSIWLMDGRCCVHRVRHVILHPRSSIGMFDSDLTKEGFYRHFIDNQRIDHHRFVIYALREMNDGELSTFCSTPFTNLTPTSSQFTASRNFTSDYEVRAYTSGCYYLDKDNQWKSDGLTVSKGRKHRPFRSRRFALGWSVNKLWTNAMLFDASHNLCWGLPTGSNEYQLEFCPGER